MKLACSNFELQLVLAGEASVPVAVPIQHKAIAPVAVAPPALDTWSGIVIDIQLH